MGDLGCVWTVREANRKEEWSKSKGVISPDQPGRRFARSSDVTGSRRESGVCLENGRLEAEVTLRTREKVPEILHVPVEV
jgi:hypothetical protein